MHLEVLDEKSKKIFSRLPQFRDFYLAGGTALALQIGHRVSVDFDLFSEKEISKDLLAKVKRVFTDNSVVPSVNNPDELTVLIDEIKVAFLAYPFPAVQKLSNLEGVALLSVKEIAASKAYTIGRRGSYKDYIDLYFIISGGHSSISEIMEIAQSKYKGEFNSRLFLEQLIYLDDIEDVRIMFLKNEVTSDDVKKFFETEIKSLKL